MFEPNCILVTGGAGFIGCNFVRQQLQMYPERHIVTLDKLTYAGSLANLESLPNPKQHHFVQGNIINIPLVRELLIDHKIDTIVHFAAESHVDRSIDNPTEFIQSNIVGTFSLLEAARDVWGKRCNLDAKRCRFHHVSTDEVFGSLQPKESAFSEQSNYQPNSPYSASKASSDHIVRAYSHTYALPTTLSHCSNNYGPYQHIEKLIPTVIRACVEQKTIPIYGDGSNIRDWLFVLDHCEAIDRILTHSLPGEHYNIGGCHEVNNLEIAQQICDIMNEIRPQANPYQELIQFVDDRPGHDWRYAINISKINEILNWKPKKTFQQGLTETIRFYLEQSSEIMLNDEALR